MIKLFTTVLVLACIALPAASIENVPIKTVTHKNITVFQPFLWTQDGFRVRINGDVTCCVDAYCCTNPVPDSITVEYAGGITTITWYGTYPQDIDSTDGRPHFGFDIENKEADVFHAEDMGGQGAVYRVEGGALCPEW